MVNSDSDIYPLIPFLKEWHYAYEVGSETNHVLGKEVTLFFLIHVSFVHGFSIVCTCPISCSI